MFSQALQKILFILKFKNHGFKTKRPVYFQNYSLLLECRHSTEAAKPPASAWHKDKTETERQLL